MREKKRYLLVRGKNLKENIPRAIQEFIGTLGMSKTSLSFIKSGDDFAVISINREMLDKVRASLCVWPEKMEVKKVSGTIRGLASYFTSNKYATAKNKNQREKSGAERLRGANLKNYRK